MLECGALRLSGDVWKASVTRRRAASDYLRVVWFSQVFILFYFNFFFLVWTPVGAPGPGSEPLMTPSSLPPSLTQKLYFLEVGFCLKLLVRSNQFFFSVFFFFVSFRILDSTGREVCPSSSPSIGEPWLLSFFSRCNSIKPAVVTRAVALTTDFFFFFFFLFICIGVGGSPRWNCFFCFFFLSNSAAESCGLCY